MKRWLCALLCLLLLAGCTQTPPQATPSQTPPSQPEQSQGGDPGEIPPGERESSLPPSPPQGSTPQATPQEGSQTPSQPGSAAQQTPSAPPKPAVEAERYYYNDRPITALYTLNLASATYHPVMEKEIALELLPLVESYNPPTVSGADSGVLLFTDRERYAWYSKEEGDPTRLWELCEENNAAAPGYAQWLVYMKPENITRVRYSGAYWGNGPWNVGVDTTDREEILRIADALKTLEVTEGRRSPHETNPTTTMDLIDLTIDFSTGVTYRIFGYLDSFCLMASDMPGNCSYQVEEEEMNALRLLMYQLPSSQANLVE